MISETILEETYIIDLNPRRIYEIKAVWKEEYLSENGFYGEAYYAFATSDVRAKAASAEIPIEETE